MNLDLKLQKHAEHRPESPAIGWDTGELTYRQLNERIQKLANRFMERGIGPGDKVAIILENSPELVISYYASMRAGVINVPVNPSLASREYGVILNDCRPKLIITEIKIVEKVKNSGLDWPVELIVTGPDFDRYIDQGGAAPGNHYQEDCTILYTSGTTGVPKGAVLTHDNLYINADVFGRNLGLTDRDRTLIVAPLTHIAAQSNLLNPTLISGGYCYLLKRWKSTVETLGKMEKKRITYFFGPPTMITYILNEPALVDYDLKLRLTYTGAAPLPEEIFQRWTERFGFEIVEGYGLTETSPVVCMNPAVGKKKLRSVGLPIEDVQVKIMSEGFEEVPPGTPGELVVKGPNVMKGYYKREEENRKAFRDGWFKTGDVAMKDDEGYIYIIDRKKDLIIRSGFNVYPREVEEVLYMHPAILEAAVIGTPHPEKGETVVAVLTLRDGYGESVVEKLEHFCRERLASYKVPSEFRVVAEFPKTNSGKIMKAKLKEVMV
ncbi:long-chain acyl-CoA synthetase [Bhargavaea ginsengi]|uniref:Long-chain acyl-CoA synthetase n=1 Tax=Bhargavaea ginsengi TaxID=426757 RepID=A0A1H6U4T9_9BACL|nr:AMP-binding protein [Bhargavaea ginsengi]SEI87359.1 long-chain acyl-CoA synthetase [Bhargavaea ginsengi]